MACNHHYMTYSRLRNVWTHTYGLDIEFPQTFELAQVFFIPVLSFVERSSIIQCFRRVESKSIFVVCLCRHGEWKQTLFNSSALLMRDVFKSHQSIHIHIYQCCEWAPVDASWNGTTTHTGLILQHSSSSGMFTEYSELSTHVPHRLVLSILFSRKEGPAPMLLYVSSSGEAVCVRFN